LLLRRSFLGRGLLLGSSLLGGAPLLGRGLTTDLQQLGGALDRDVLDEITLAQRRVHVTVGDVGPEAPILHDDLLARHGIVAELAQRRRRSRPTPTELLGLGQKRLGVVERDREDLFLGLEAAGLVALLDVGPVAAVLGGDLRAVALDTD